jgi:hypothetical protein
MTGQGAPTVADVIRALLLCGLLGVLGQGVRAIVGLKNEARSTPRLRGSRLCSALRISP